jgi:maltose 6'-phosphate phosphatase
MGEPDGFGGRNSAFGVGPDPTPEGGFRVASLNLHTYQEPEALLKLGQAAFGLAALGVQAAALQEVGEHLTDPGRGNAGGIIRGHLERWTGRRWYHEWRMAHLGFGVYREGVSLLAATPLQDVQEFRLSEGPFARNALAGVVTIGGQALRLCSTHLSWGGDEGEVRRLLQSLAAARPAVGLTLVAGDFNARQSDAPVRRMIDAGYRDVARLAGSPGPTDEGSQGRIDYQFLHAAAGGTLSGVRACATAVSSTWRSATRSRTCPARRRSSTSSAGTMLATVLPASTSSGWRGTTTNSWLPSATTCCW